MVVDSVQSGQLQVCPSRIVSHMPSAHHSASTRPSPMPTHMRCRMNPLTPRTAAAPTAGPAPLMLHPKYRGNCMPIVAPSRTVTSVTKGRETFTPAIHSASPKAAPIIAMINAPSPGCSGKSWSKSSSMCGCASCALSVTLLQFLVPHLDDRLNSFLVGPLPVAPVFLQLHMPRIGILVVAYNA